MKLGRIAMVLLVGAGTLPMMGQQTKAANTKAGPVQETTPVTAKSLVPLFSMGAGGKLSCTISGKACTEKDIDKFNTTLVSGKVAPGAIKSNIARLVLAPNGSLTCITNENKQQSCSAAHIADFNEVATRPSSGSGQFNYPSSGPYCDAFCKDSPGCNKWPACMATKAGQAVQK
jgi:hypothetical protein